MKLSREHELTEHRCYECGRFWALEAYAPNGGTCPNCAQLAKDARYAELDAARRTISALKGAVTRLSRARKR